MTEPRFPAKGDAGSEMRLRGEGEGRRGPVTVQSHSTKALCCEPRAGSEP